MDSIYIEVIQCIHEVSFLYFTVAAATFISGAMSGANSTATLSWKADTAHILCCLVINSLDLLTKDFLCLGIYYHCLLIYFFARRLSGY